MQDLLNIQDIAFILQGGFISISVAVMLIAMSICSWFLMLRKVMQLVKYKQLIGQYIQHFWQNETLQSALKIARPASPAYRVGLAALQSAEHHHHFVKLESQDSCSRDEFIARNLKRALMQEQSQMEAGLSILASIGSVAPFVGLFGTVWGIYHALSAISESGLSTIDKVAGPVGEALIMTAIGLAVAIPAVLAYNAILKANKKQMAYLENFAQDIHTLLTTGAPLFIHPKQTDNVTPINQAHQTMTKVGV